MEGKVTIITGGAFGIGEAIAHIFTKKGAKVIIADVADVAGKKLAESISPPAIFVHCDLTNKQDVGATVDLAIEKHGQLDIIFNNAGIIAPGKSLAEYDMDQFDRVIRVNVRGVMVGMKHAAYAMILRNKGTIINTGNITSVIRGIFPYDYTSAVELGKYGVWVNVVSPYGLPTDLTVGNFKKEGYPSTFSKEVDKPVVADFCTRVANLGGMVLTAEGVAQAGPYLASDESKYVSGHNLIVDGGINVVNHSWGTYQ